MPLYFTFTGLNVDLGNLNDVLAWQIVILVCFCASASKIIGCYIGALATGLEYRQSLTLGILMNTRGLMEIIVLNFGVESGVISPKVYSILFIMGLFTTVITIPLVRYIYPYSFYVKLKPEVIDHVDAMLELPEAPQEIKLNKKILLCLISMRTVPGNPLD